MNNAMIYVLKDPRINDKIKSIRYIGVTKKSLDRRLCLHLSEARRSEKEYYKLRWIRKLLREDVEPIIKKMDIFPENIIFEKEIEYIKKYKSLGCRLVNSTEGGEGILNPSLETRLKISIANKNVSLESRERRRQFMLGKKLSEETKRKLSIIGKIRGAPILSQKAKNKISKALKNNKNGLGYRHTAKTREKMSLMKMGNKGRLGIPHTIETKEKLRISHSGEKSSSVKLTWNEVKEIRKKYKTAHYTQQKLADDYKITLGTINPLIKNRTWKIENLV